MEQQKPSKFKSASNFGLMLGLVLMVISLLVFLLELYEYSWINVISTIVLIIGIVMGIKKFRDQENGGFISYGGALGYGTLVSLVAAIITSVITFIYLSYVDDSFIQFTLDKQETAFYEQGIPDEQIEISMSYVRKFTSPGMMGVMGVIMTTLMGFITSLIAAAFLKKESDSIDDL